MPIVVRLPCGIDQAVARVTDAEFQQPAPDELEIVVQSVGVVEVDVDAHRVHEPIGCHRGIPLRRRRLERQPQ